MTLILSIAGAITGINAAIGVLWVVFGWGKKIVEGQKCQLRSDMLSVYYRHREARQLRQYEYEHFVFCFEAYKAMRGNSFIDRIYKEVQEWEVLP